MKLIRRLICLVALSVVLVCIVLLLNFTAPNPTGRRYSSETVSTRGSVQSIGLSGEEILSRDLRTPRNEAADQRQCVCNNPNSPPSASECRVCVAYDASISTFRRPDFIGANFIAESKNRQNLLYTHADQVDQITDYVTAARVMQRPLWLFVRVDTVLDPVFYQLAESTGGGVVRYFATPGYIDPVDQVAGKALPIAAILVIITGVWELGAQRVSAPRPPSNPVAEAKRKTDSAENFAKAAKDRAQRKIDVEDSRQDDPKLE
jgi:hypothetical protein